MTPLSERAITVNTPFRATQSADHILALRFGRRQLQIEDVPVENDLALAQQLRAEECAERRRILAAASTVVILDVE